MYTITRRSELRTASWAGGTTTQLVIYPSTATYTEFNFDFRISYATVEVEESTFTFMPGVTRHLMILKGALDIDHIDRYAKHLEKFDVDTFFGEWPTKARGKVMDFNLMTRGDAKGELEAMIFERNSERTISLDNADDHTGIYLLNGNVEMNFKGENVSLQEGDFILFENDHGSNILLKASDNSELVVARVKL